MTNDGFNGYTYDAEGNVLTVGGNAAATYVYDAMNHRTWVQTNGTTYEYTFDIAGRRVSSWPQTVNIANEGRIYWDGQPLANRSNDGSTYFQHENYLGTERLRTNSAGAVAATFTSLAWGDGYAADIVDNGANQDIVHFAGLDQDGNPNTDLVADHAQFRDYSFVQGRWLQPDSYNGSYDLTNPQSLNRYAYALNNPLSFTDPSGLVLCDYGSSDLGGEDYEVADTNDECTTNGGTPSVASTTVSVSASSDSGTGNTTLDGGGTSTFIESFQMTPFAPGGCTGTGVLLGVGGNADLGVVGGATAQGSAMIGTTTSATGGTLSGGAMVGGPSGTVGAPTQATHSAVFGAYIGGGLQVSATNAGSMKALSGPFSTLAVNAGLGFVNFGLSISWSGGIVQGSISFPALSFGGGFAVSYTTTTTSQKTTSSAPRKGC